MSSRAAMAAFAVGLIALAGCQSENKERQALVDAGVKSCVDGFQSSGAAAGTGADPQRICTCAIQKMTEGKSVEEIRKASTQTDPTESDVQAISACVIEEIQRKSEKAG